MGKMRKIYNEVILEWNDITHQFDTVSEDFEYSDESVAELMAECFIAGTKVIMKDGPDKNIEDIVEGDEVLSYNVHTGQFEPKEVEWLLTQTHTDIEGGDITVKITYDNGTVTHNTIANPFWSRDKGFVAVDAERCNTLHQWVWASNYGKKVEQLEVGDVVYEYDDSGELNEVIVTDIEPILESGIRTYDIHVKDNHTFFADGILTHNTGGGGCSGVMGVPCTAFNGNGTMCNIFYSYCGQYNQGNGSCGATGGYVPCANFSSQYTEYCTGNCSFGGGGGDGEDGGGFCPECGVQPNCWYPEEGCGCNDGQGASADVGCGCGEPAPCGCNDCGPGCPSDDCAGECGGVLVNDECGVCGGMGIPSWACDCDGNVLDDCGVCDGSGPSDGQYSSEGVCYSHTVCTNTQYESTAPTTTSDRGCTDLTVCTNTQYESTAPTTTSDRGCSSCTTCTDGSTYETTACSGTTNRVCSSCATCTDGSTYETTACSGTTNRVCSSCATCASNQTETTACSGTTNRICSDCAGTEWGTKTNTLCYRDADVDGFGDPGNSETQCTEGNTCNTGWVIDSTDDSDDCVGTYYSGCAECGGGCNNPCFSYSCGDSSACNENNCDNAACIYATCTNCGGQSSTCDGADGQGGCFGQGSCGGVTPCGSPTNCPSSDGGTDQDGCYAQNTVTCYNELDDQVYSWTGCDESCDLHDGWDDSSDEGCTYFSACNYNVNADTDDDSCFYYTDLSCSANSSYDGYDFSATPCGSPGDCSGTSCQSEITIDCYQIVGSGVTQVTSCNPTCPSGYDTSTDTGCMDATACNYNSNANEDPNSVCNFGNYTDDGGTTCCTGLEGGTDNSDERVTCCLEGVTGYCNEGSSDEIYCGPTCPANYILVSASSGTEVGGCTDPKACTQDGTAAQGYYDDGSCEYTSCCDGGGTTTDAGVNCTCDSTHCDYRQGRCEYSLDTCGDCDVGGSADIIIGEGLDIYSFVPTADFNMDDCGVCDTGSGGAWKSGRETCVVDATQENTGNLCYSTGDCSPTGETCGMVLHYPDIYYTYCYAANLDDDNPQGSDGPPYDTTQHFVCGANNVGQPVSCASYDCNGAPCEENPIYDVGCPDITACNYEILKETCQNGYDAGYDPTNPFIDTANPGSATTECCVYPVEYCQADGSNYYDPNGYGLGNSQCCDVQGPDDDYPGDIISSEYYCDDINETNHIPDGTVGEYEDIPVGWDVASNGLDTHPDCGGWTLTGCPDPVALNFEVGSGAGTLYLDPAEINIYDQYPVTTCEYCSDMTTHDFYWNKHTDGATASYDPDVVIEDSIFLFGEDIDVDGYTETGHCFFKTDVSVIGDLTAVSSTPDAKSMQINLNSGESVWDINGNLTSFIAGNIGLTEIPISIGNATSLTTLDLSDNSLGAGDASGIIPVQIQDLTSLTTLYLNNNELSTIETNGELGAGGDGICALLYNGNLQFDGNFQLYWNKICPTVSDSVSGEASYPACLMAAPVGWLTANLSITVSDPNNPDASFGTEFGWDDGDTGGIQDLTDCSIIGCTDPQARNYWPEATTQCGGSFPGCCSYDDYLHFKWGNTYGPPEGSYGGDMTTVQMVQALHANIYGLSYQHGGELDVTHVHSADSNDIQWMHPEDTSLTGECDDTFPNTDACWQYCAADIINNCSAEFPTESQESAMGDNIISEYDGLWIRWKSGLADSPLIQSNCISSYGQSGQTTTACQGDSRPLEFIQRVQWLKSVEGGNDLTAEYTWYGYFPQGGFDYSMFGIEYFEDYDLNGDGQLDSTDQGLWEDLGRYDIAQYIESMIDGDMNIPSGAPVWTEFWADETAVSMSYGQDFITTEIPSGQFKCSDGGDASICYTDPYPCGLVDNDYLATLGFECTSCGTGGNCIPLTIRTAKLGHDKIIKSGMKTINYFTGDSVDKNSGISGSSIYTASMADTNKKYYFGVTDGDPNSPKSNTQFYITWGHRFGSGSITNNNDIKGASEAVYRQYASALLDPDRIDKGFLISSGSDVRSDGNDGNVDNWIYILNFKKSRFKDQLQSGNWTLTLSGSDSNGSGKTLHLTDDSKVVTTPPNVTDAGHVYSIVSGSAGSMVGNVVGGRYGYIYPDVGLMVFGEKLSNEFRSVKNPKIAEFNKSGYSILTGTITASNGSKQISGSGTNFTGSLVVGDAIRIDSGSGNEKYSQKFIISSIKNQTSMSLNSNWGGGTFSGSFLYKNSGHDQLYPLTSSNQDDKNALRFVNTMRNVSGNSLTLFGEKEVTNVIYLCRIPNTHFNHTNNFTILSGSGRNMFNNDVGRKGGFIITSGSYTGYDGVDYISGSSTMDGDPQSFITQVHLYDNYGTCVAIAALSKSLQKNFSREAVIKVKLEF